MRWHGQVFSALVLAGLLLPLSGQALTLEPPLPRSCSEAKAALEPQDKVSLYTRCLDGNDPFGIRLEKYQRNEMHFLRANALFELRRYAEALIDYDRFIANQRGSHVWALHQRGLTHQAMAQWQLAATDFDMALEINPDALGVRFDRSQLLAEMGLYQPALEDLHRVTTSSPKSAEYANALAWLLATCPDAKIHDGKEALRFALKAVSIDRNAQYLDTLAAAQARNGDFKQAVITQQAALDLLRKDKTVQEEAITELTTRLSLYVAGKPYTQQRSK